MTDTSVSPRVTVSGPAVPRATSPASGIVLALVSAAAFGTSGAVGRSLLDGGWTAGAVVTLRISLAAVVLLVPTWLALRGRWTMLRRQWAVVLAYGIFAVAMPTLAYFSAIQHLSVGVALLIEYLAPVLIVGYLWARTRRAPGWLTTVGVVLSLAGLVLVLDVTGDVRVSAVGVMWALLAAVGLAVYFLLADSGTDSGADTDALPPIALAGAGLVVGSLALAVAGLTGLVPMGASTDDVVLGEWTVSWWVPVLELALLAAAFGYVLGILAIRRLGSTVSSFVALTEVLFAVLFAWWLLGELPVPVQLLGGGLIVCGVAAVRLGGTKAPATPPTPTEDQVPGTQAESLIRSTRTPR